MEKSVLMKNIFRAERAWPLGLAAGLIVFIAINLAFVTVAFQNKPELVSENYYAEGYNLRAISERNAAGEAAGWSVSLKLLPLEQADMPLAELTAAESDGTPADSLLGGVGFYRPSNKALDIAPLPVQFVGGGRYLIFLPRALERGAWQAEVNLARGKNAFEKRMSLFVEK